MAIAPIKVPIVLDDKFTKRLSAAGRQIDKFGSRARKAGKKMTMFFTLPIAGAAAGAVKASMDINKAMANVATLIPGQLGRVQELKKEVQDLSVATGKSSTDIASGLFQVISAFGDSAETAKLLEINTKAAVAGVSEVADSINLTSAVTKAFGDTSAEATQKVVDLAFKTNELGQTTFPEMAAALPRVTALSKDLGVRMDEMFAVFATGTGVTGNTAEVSTQLASVLGALTKPTADMEIALKKLGFTGRTAGRDLIASKGLVGAMQALNDITKKYDVPLGKVLGRKEGLILTTALLGAQSDTYASKLSKLGDVTGATDKAFKEQTEGINEAGFAWSQFTRRVERVAQRLGDRLAPAFMRVLDIGSKVLGWFDKLSPAMKKVLGVTAAVWAAIGPLTSAFGFLASMVGKVLIVWGKLVPWILKAVPVFKAIGAAITGTVLSPVLLVAGALAAVLNTIRLIVKNWEGLKFAFSSLKNLKNTFGFLFKGDSFDPNKGASPGLASGPATGAAITAATAGGGRMESNIKLQVESKNSEVKLLETQGSAVDMITRGSLFAGVQ